MNFHDRYLLGDSSRCRYCGRKEYASEGGCDCSIGWACLACEGESFTRISRKGESLVVECDNCGCAWDAVPDATLEEYNEYEPEEDDDDAPAVD